MRRRRSVSAAIDKGNNNGQLANSDLNHLNAQTDPTDTLKLFTPRHIYVRNRRLMMMMVMMLMPLSLLLM